MSKVKVAAYVTANTDSRQNVCRFLTYLARERVEMRPPRVAPRPPRLEPCVVVVAPRGDCEAERHKTLKTIFSNQTNPKNPERLARSRSGLRDAMLLQLHAF